MTAPSIVQPSLEKLLERFWAKVDKNGPTPISCPERGPCWIWTASITDKKRGGHEYGQFWNGKKLISAHRFSYAVHNGLLIRGLQVCHHCDVQRCVRPNHLYQGNQTQNEQDKVRRGRHYHQKRTHCFHGHPFEGTNLRYTPNGWRYCGLCRVENNLRRSERRRAQHQAKRFLGTFLAA